MIPVQLNYWAILVSALVVMVLRLAWYAKPFLGRFWLKHIEKTETELKKKAPTGKYVTIFVLALVFAYIFSHFIDYAGATTVGEGMRTGLWLWLGFVATTLFSSSFFESRPLKPTLVDAGYYLICLLAVGAILTTWT